MAIIDFEQERIRRGYGSKPEPVVLRVGDRVVPPTADRQPVRILAFTAGEQAVVETRFGPRLFAVADLIPAADFQGCAS